jgi:hypothetical protein
MDGTHYRTSGKNSLEMVELSSVLIEILKFSLGTVII